MGSQGRGRPPLAWLTYDEALAQPTDTALLVDQGYHEVRLVGRVVPGEVLTLRTRRGELIELGRDRFGRARVVDGLPDPELQRL